MGVIILIYGLYFKTFRIMEDFNNPGIIGVMTILAILIFVIGIPMLIE